MAGPVIFHSLNKKNKKQKFFTRNPGDAMGISGCGSFFCLWAVRARCSRAHVYRAMGDAPYPPGTMKIERGVVYNPTIRLGYLLEKNIHPGRHQPWPLPPHIGPPRPFRSNGRRPLPPAPRKSSGGGCITQQSTMTIFTINSSSWAPPAMVSTAAYGPSAAIPLKGAR